MRLDPMGFGMQTAMESKKTLPAACVNGINAFGEIERDCIHAALEKNPSLYMLIPILK